jgi:hypothetical protein
VDDPYLEYAPKQFYIKMVLQIIRAVEDLAYRTEPVNAATPTTCVSRCGDYLRRRSFSRGWSTLTASTVSGRSIWDVADDHELRWSSKEPDQAVVWGSWVELGAKFCKALLVVPVPTDMRVIRAVKSSPLALDVLVCG